MPSPLVRFAFIVSLAMFTVSEASFALPPSDPMPASEKFVIAAANGDRSAVEKAIAGGVDINSKSQGWWGTVAGDETALVVAGRAGNYDMMKLLLEKGADINIPGNYSMNLLDRALERRDIELVKFFIENGGRYDPYHGRSFVEKAVTFDDTSLLEMVLEKGAISTRYALDICSGKTRFEHLKILIKYGASPDTALTIAAPRGSSRTIAFLLDSGANANANDPESGRTPLSYAAMYGNVEGVRVLLERGADPNRRDTGGHAPLYFAEREGHSEIEDLLYRAGASSSGGIPMSERMSDTLKSALIIGLLGWEVVRYFPLALPIAVLVLSLPVALFSRKKKRVFRFAAVLAVIALLGFYLTHSKTGGASGTIVSRETGKPVAGAKVIVSFWHYQVFDGWAESFGVYTDESGRFELSMPTSAWVDRVDLAILTKDGEGASRHELGNNSETEIEVSRDMAKQGAGSSYDSFSGNWVFDVKWVERLPSGNRPPR